MDLYKQALERAKECLQDGTITTIARDYIWKIFPELKENEDQRIRKALKRGLSDFTTFGCINVEEIITWLEKQGEQPTDKVGPKLHEGDWIISNNKKSIFQVIEVKRGIYVIRDNVDNHVYHIGIEECEKSGRLWSINDAKDGDVLSFYFEYKGNKMEQTGIIEKYVGKHGGCSNTFKVYVGVNWENNFQIGEYMGCSDIRPATKKQRDLLFQKIKEAGYKWNAEKKELKRICEPKTLDTDKVIDKACEWIHTALYLDYERSIEHRYATMEELLNDFRKAMKGGES